MAQDLRVEPVTGCIGARVLDLDLRELDDSQFDHLRQLWYRHKVLFFPAQTTDPAVLRRFARRFGELEPHHYAPEENADSVIPQPVSAECSEVVRVTERSRADAWHTDHSFYRKPSKCTVFQYLEGPPGGDTMWADLEAAYAALSGPMQQMLAGLTALHTGASVTLPHKTAAHPVVRYHPVTKAPALYVNRSNTAYIREVHRLESNALLRMLFEHCERPQFVCRYRWQPGDIAVWDNRVTMHFAVNDYAPGLQRTAQRAVVVGDRPRTESALDWPNLEAAPTYLSAGVELFMSSPS